MEQNPLAEGLGKQPPFRCSPMITEWGAWLRSPTFKLSGTQNTPSHFLFKLIVLPAFAVYECLPIKGMLNQNLQLTKQGWSDRRDDAEPKNITRTTISLTDGFFFFFFGKGALNQTRPTRHATSSILSPSSLCPLKRVN